MYLKSFILLFIFSITLQSEQLDELMAAHVDNKWIVDFISENEVYATVNGTITYGDRLRFRLVKGSCDMVNILTSVYTILDPTKVAQLKGRSISIQFLGEEKKANVLYVIPFLSGQRALIDLGWADVDSLKNLSDKMKIIDIKYIDSDSETIKVSKCFDILENSWSTNGLSEALDHAIKICRKL